MTDGDAQMIVHPMLRMRSPAGDDLLIKSSDCKGYAYVDKSYIYALYDHCALAP